MDLGAEDLRRCAELREGRLQLGSQVSLSMAPVALVPVVDRKSDRQAPGTRHHVTPIIPIQCR